MKRTESSVGNVGRIQLRMIPIPADAGGKLLFISNQVYSRCQARLPGKLLFLFSCRWQRRPAGVAGVDLTRTRFIFDPGKLKNNFPEPYIPRSAPVQPFS